ncbi:MAG TPA: type II toxin-antitoxin system HipA family toxin YjjJ [Desulfuromonadales bacterium]|nr:type II toxin-antitoxin system HipA family toxin YjjJ [Desulfuromonadales bacterium]
MPVNSEKTNKLLTLLYDRPLPARKLRQLLGDISPATLSRLVKQVGTKVISFGQARARTYARPRDLRGIGHQLPVYRIDENGNAHLTGTLWSLHGGYWWVGDGWAARHYPFIPWFIYDLKPDGFVGRAFARRFAVELGLSERLSSWQEEDILIALSRRGEDTVGDLIVGEESLSRYMTASRLQPAVCVPDDYPELAHKVMAGDSVGSSAGGEQPKFTALTVTGGVPARVLIKFSPQLSTPYGQRWSDLLICEHIALAIVRDMGISSTVSTIHQIGNRTFLEVVRFDRDGLFGRTPLNSLTVVDAEFIGVASNWTAAAHKLLSVKMLPPDDAASITKLDLFGSLIANTDRHHGNISLIPANEERTKFRLAPIYDMLPMFYRPKEGEELSSGTYQPPATGVCGDVYENAMRFWREAGMDLRISERFRKLCRENRAVLQQMARGPRIIRQHPF